MLSIGDLQRHVTVIMHIDAFFSWRKHKNIFYKMLSNQLNNSNTIQHVINCLYIIKFLIIVKTHRCAPPGFLLKLKSLGTLLNVKCFVCIAFTLFQITFKVANDNISNYTL